MKTDKKLHSIISMALILFFLGLISATVTHAETYTCIKMWGSSGNGSGQFNTPTGIAVDSLGNVYVADTDNCRIEKFDSNGNFIAKWGSYGSGNGQFVYQVGVAVDSSGNVYVADSASSSIEKFDSNGNFITSWGSGGTDKGQFLYPAAVTVDSSGNVYVADMLNRRIQKFDRDGNYLTEWGSFGTGVGNFSNPVGVAVDSSDNVYVVESFNNRTQKFDSNGNFITTWGSGGTDKGQFSYPAAVTVDSSGNVYVAEYYNHRIQKFDRNGNYLTQWGSFGTGDGQFDSPEGIAVDSSGNVYVADTDNDRIQKFASSEKLVLPTANFTSNVTSGYAPLSVQFNDSSKNATGWKWNFGDGTNSTTQNPMHTYSAVGNYTVNLTANNENGTDSKLAAINVSQLPPLPVVKYSAFPRYGKAPLMVAFRDNSTGSPYAWKWTFGDGEYSTIQNPIHKYSQEGNYSVTLTVTNAAGSSSFKKARYIQVITNTRPGPYSSK